MAAQDDAAGRAALSICESLMIALVEKGILSLEEARGALEDAAAAHQNIDTLNDQAAVHQSAGLIIERLLTQIGAAKPTDNLG
ncbi:hypothetical protein [Azospirillum sp. SYSU D00513]|uniref:hypothetical protein n=1 Tax=Azospirillum sp. SYSU D00513 TaxID=2812561 RepID=UPI001A97C5C7|nr:hypothetical protein [Azospirillum sp. SYSU D00513]